MKKLLKEFKSLFYRSREIDLLNQCTNDHYNTITVLSTENNDLKTQISLLNTENNDLKTQISLLNTEIASMREFIKSDEETIKREEADKNYWISVGNRRWEKMIEAQDDLTHLKDHYNALALQLKYTRLVGCIFMVISIIQSLYVIRECL